MMSELKTVVVVNDDRTILELMRDILGYEGYRVVVAEDASQAYHLIQARPPSLAILDVRMPGSPDWQTLDLLKRDPSTASVPVLVCSASAREMQEAEVAIRARGCDLLYMPFEIDDLLEEVGQLTRIGATPPPINPDGRG